MQANTLVDFQETKLRAQKTTKSTVKVNMPSRRYNRSTTKEAVQDILTNCIPTSNSGRTLGEILNISGSVELYSIDDVRYGWNGLSVTYSRPPDDLATLTRRVDDMVAEAAEQRAHISRLELNVVQLQAESRDHSKLLETWQLYHLAVNGTASFAWDLVSHEDKVQLQEHHISDFLGVFYSRHEFGQKGDLARKVYSSVAWEVRCYMEDLVARKGQVADQQKMVAHPTISEANINSFLAERQAAFPSLLSPLATQLFDHLRVVVRG